MMGFFKQVIVPLLVVSVVLIGLLFFFDRCLGKKMIGRQTLHKEHSAISLQVSQAAEANHHGFQQMFNDHTAMGTELERVRKELNEVNLKLNILLNFATNRCTLIDGPRK